MSWSYHIREAEGAVISKGGGFATQTAAMAAGKAEVERLKLTGSNTRQRFWNAYSRQDSAPWQPNLQAR